MLVRTLGGTHEEIYTSWHYTFFCAVGNRDI